MHLRLNASCRKDGLYPQTNHKTRKQFTRMQDICADMCPLTAQSRNAPFRPALRHPDRPYVDAPPPIEQLRQGFLYVGRLSVEKGISSMAQAALLVPNINLRVAGDGPQAELLRE